MNSSRRLRVFPSGANGFSLQSKEQEWLVPIIKGSGFLRSGFLSVIQPVSCASVTWPSSRHVVGFLVWRKGTKLLINWLLLPMSSKSSLVFDPGVTCLLLESMKLWQANLLAYKWGKISLFVILDNFCCIFFPIRLSYPISFLSFLSSFCSVKVYLPHSFSLET